MIHTVSFPGLGLTFTLNRVAFTLLGRPVYWYGIIIASGLLLAVFLCGKWGKRFGITEDQITDMMICAVPVALVAIRAYYVIFNLGLYRRADGSLDWGAILRYSDGGLAIYGAILSSLVVLLLFCHVKKISFLAFADLGVHGLFIGQLIGRWGNFMNVEAYGGPTTLPWRMCGESIARNMLDQGYVDQAGYQAILSGNLGVHPTFLYESLWNLAGLFLVYHLGKKRRFDGQCFLFYVFWYGLGRAWIEGLRTDSLMLVPSIGLRVSQLLAGIAVVAGVAAEIYFTRKFKGKPLMVPLAMTAENKAAMKKLDGPIAFAGADTQLPASASRKEFVEKTERYNAEVKQKLEEQQKNH